MPNGHSSSFEDTPTLTLVRDLISDFGRLAQKEANAARAEVREELRDAKQTAALAAGGAGFLAAAAVLLSFALVFALWEAGLPLWASTLVVGGAFLLLGGGLLAAGVARARQLRVVPRESLQHAREDVGELRRRVRLH